MVLGLILMGAVLTLFTSMLESNTAMVKRFQLERELRATMGLMVRDTRRIGYDAEASPLPGYTNPYGLIDPTPPNGKTYTTVNCLLFTYDYDSDGGTPDANEHFGYRFVSNGSNSHGVVQILQDASKGCDSAQGWETITRGGLVNITELKFVVIQAPAGDMRVRAVQVTLTGQLVDAPEIKQKIKRVVLLPNDAVTNGGQT